ncbi:TetR/AcrR family transcriptional regulator; helix-turn-helix transcriptional regulator [Asticcacaulis sp. DW145]|uniref:TetR/AcrR family transcriptional regulator n=1 Tax=Asticcacaulis sp. DW145 TaxID=3095608 RepID=UPI00308A10FD|nr:TetR/AcrR family transcriptional regulator; helix-turn-helix transcriptional regulator [Asticcacaulis sp. DW145]
MTPGPELLNRVQTAFLSRGFQKLTMEALAEACGFTRRTLYNYFENKDAAFRAMFRQHNLELMHRAFEVARREQAAGAEVLDVFTALIDIRYGDTWRLIQPSPHALEIKGTVFRICTDIMIELATVFQSDLAAFIDTLTQAGALRLKGDYSAAELAQMLADAARGVNAVYPLLPLEHLTGQYRRITRAILYGYLDA